MEKNCLQPDLREIFYTLYLLINKQDGETPASRFTQLCQVLKNIKKKIHF